jgi:hypothetical protein
MEAAKKEDLETWDRLALLLIARPLAGWEDLFEDLRSREIGRLVDPVEWDSNE